MNGWAFGAVVIVCLTVAFGAVAWALVRSGSRTGGSVSTGREEPAAEGAAQAPHVSGRDELRQRIAAAAERALREQGGGF